MSNIKGNTEKNRFTKNCVFMALNKLLTQKKLNEITISEISEVAGVSRTTFYRNYSSVRDILVDFLNQHPFGAESVDSYSPQQFKLEDRLRNAFDFLSRQRNIIFGIVNSNEERLLYEVTEKAIRNECIDRVYEIGFRTEYEVAALTGMFYGICMDWIYAGMPESVNEMVDITYRIIHTFYKDDNKAFPERDNVYTPLYREK